MKRLSLWLGLLSILYAGLYFLGFLPVSIWQYVLDLFIDRDPDTFYKIVPIEGAGVACLVGLSLIAFSKLPFKSGQNNE